MPRRGWSVAPDGWVQFIRGPRLPVQRWPMAQGNPGCREVTSPWSMAERSTSASWGIESCRSSGAGSCSIGARGWGCQGRTRSSVATCQREGKSCRAKSRTCPRGHDRSCTSQSCEVGSISRSIGEPCGTRSRCIDSSFGACQSCGVPSTHRRPSDAVPTVHRSDGEAPRRIGSSRSASRRLGTGCHVCERQLQPKRQCHLLWCQMSPQKWRTSGMWSLSCRHSWPSPR